MERSGISPRATTHETSPPAMPNLRITPTHNPKLHPHPPEMDHIPILNHFRLQWLQWQFVQPGLIMALEIFN